jgi:hypothetical protein
LGGGTFGLYGVWEKVISISIGMGNDDDVCDRHPLKRSVLGQRWPHQWERQGLRVLFYRESESVKNDYEWTCARVARGNESGNWNDAFDGLRSEGYTWVREEHTKGGEEDKLLVQACNPQVVACRVGARRPQVERIRGHQSAAQAE